MKIGVKAFGRGSAIAILAATLSSCKTGQSHPNGPEMNATNMAVEAASVKPDPFGDRSNFIKALHPINVYADSLNIVVVQRSEDGIEYGKYITLFLSSFMRLEGTDGFYFRPGGRSFDDDDHGFVQDYVRIPPGRKLSDSKLPEDFWGPTLVSLHPMSVYHDGCGNLVVAQQITNGIERGRYLVSRESPQFWYDCALSNGLALTLPPPSESKPEPYVGLLSMVFSYEKGANVPVLPVNLATLKMFLGTTNLPTEEEINAYRRAYTPLRFQSSFFHSITWHWETYTNAAIGSDLWPITWGADDNLYSAWGDGGGFGGSDSLGRVSAGFARIEGGPENFHGFNVNGGFNAEHPADFPTKGKVSGIVSVDGTLYANINLQDGPWPDIHHQLAWSTNHGATWARADWIFEKGVGQFQPAKFLNFGKDYSGVPPHLDGYVYLYGFKQPEKGGETRQVFLARVGRGKILQRDAYEFLQGFDDKNAPKWNTSFAHACPMFNERSTTTCSVVYDAPLNRYIATAFHAGAGQLGIFDAPEPWGPWTTVAYYENWGDMGTNGEGLNCEFPAKWISSDGLTLWSIFSVYGDGGKIGIKAHDRFNLVKITLGRAAAKSH